jgi:hypothetical protein
VSNILPTVSPRTETLIQARVPYRIIMRTVCGSNGDQSPFTSAVRSSASVKLPLSAHTPVSFATPTPTQHTHYRDPRYQTAPTAPRDHSHLSAAQASAAASRSAQSAGAHGTLAAGARGRSSQAAATRRRTARRAAAGRRTARWSRILTSPGMRRAAAAARSLSGAARTGRPGDSRAAGWGGRCAARASRAAACCSRGARTRCVVGVARTRGGLGTAFARPGRASVSYIHDLEKCDTHLLGLGVHRQPVRVEAFVVRHGGVAMLEVCGGTTQAGEG